MQRPVFLRKFIFSYTLDFNGQLIPKNATVFRTIAMFCSLTFAFYLGKYQPENSDLAIFIFHT